MMTRYAEIEGGLVVGTKQMASNFVAADVLHKTDWRPVGEIPHETYDATTHKLGGWTYIVYPTNVDAQRTVEPMSAAEIDAKAERDADTADLDAAKALYSKLMDGTATANQVKRVVARLLKMQMTSDV